jgi:hypothetical protein
MQNPLARAIARKARPTTLAALMNDLIDSECDPNLTDAEALEVEQALQLWLVALRSNVGEDEADRLIAEAIEAADPVPDVRVVWGRP